MIGGNTTGTILQRELFPNAIGENSVNHVEVQDITGWLDLMSDQTERARFKSELPQGSHVFMCDYSQAPWLSGRDGRDLAFRDANGRVYDITHIDNVMEMNRHFEISLRLVGE